MLDDGSCAMISESMVNATQGSSNPSHVMGQVHEEHMYIRPLTDRGGCRVHFLSRVDIRYDECNVTISMKLAMIQSFNLYLSIEKQIC